MSDEATRLVEELARLYGQLLRTGRGLTIEPALTATQRLALSELVAADALRLGALADRMGTTDPTASRAVDGLVDAGLVERRPDPADRRAVQLAATDAGRERIEQRRREVADAVADALVGLDPADRERLIELVSALADGLARDGAGQGRGALLATR